VLDGPLIGIEWANPHQSPPSWLNWASHFGLAPPERPCELSFSLSNAAIDAAANDGGFVLGQTSMVADDLAKGKLVIASDHWMRFSEPYALAWNPASLDRPSGTEFRNFLIRAGSKLRAQSDQHRLR
jgi:LysR family glycine cleavage system transcriptional activator